MKIFDSFAPEAVEMLKNGGVGIIPTDTVYGLVGQLFNQAAVERMYDLKDRPGDKPVGTILFSDPTQIEAIVPPDDLLRAEVYWPGPTSVILETGNQLRYACRGWHSLPFRVPGIASLRNLIAETGPLAITSANIAGRTTASTVQDAMSIFRESVDFYVDGGDLSGRVPSKIIKFNKNGEATIIRGDTK